MRLHSAPTTMRPSLTAHIAWRSRSTAPPAQSAPPPSVVAVVRHLRAGDFPRAVSAFRRVPPADARACPALHEALVLACAEVPDAHAAAAVLAAAPRPTLAAFGHCVTAYVRERNPGAAVEVLERLPAAGLPLHPRTLELVRRAVKLGLRGSGGGSGRALGRSPPRRPRNVSGGVDDLQVRLDRLSALTSSSRGLAAISLSGADFFERSCNDVESWIVSRNAVHLQSLQFISNVARTEALPAIACKASAAELFAPTFIRAGAEGTVTRIASAGEAGPASATRRVPPEVALRSARGNLARVDAVWAEISSVRDEYEEPKYLAGVVSAYLSCGWHGPSRALDAISAWLKVHARDPNSFSLGSILESPTRRAMLLTAVTSTLGSSASTSPARALTVSDSFLNLPVPAFYSSLPLSGAIFKVLRHSRLSLAETLDRIDSVRSRLAQLDERSFSMALSAILECASPAAEKWASANAWVQKMRLAGVPLTLHTYNAFALQLRNMNDPKLATSLLRDMARSGVRPTAYTYSLMYESCVAPGPYTASARRRALPVSSLLAVLSALEEHMNVMGVVHESVSQFALARALAHLGQTRRAAQVFDLALTQSGATDKSAGRPSQARRDFNQMLFTAAHCRSLTPDGPAAAFAYFDRMQDMNVTPSTSTLESLLASCVRLGDNVRGLEYLSIFRDLQTTSGSVFTLRKGGVGSILALLAKAGDLDAWNACELVLEQSLRDLRKKASPPALSPAAVELAVLAFARRGQRDVCEKLIDMSGVGDLNNICWQMILDGTGEFERVREVLRRKKHSHEAVRRDMAKGEKLNGPGDASERANDEPEEFHSACSSFRPASFSM